MRKLVWLLQSTRITPLDPLLPKAGLYLTGEDTLQAQIRKLAKKKAKLERYQAELEKRRGQIEGGGSINANQLVTARSDLENLRKKLQAAGFEIDASELDSKRTALEQQKKKIRRLMMMFVNLYYIFYFLLLSTHRQ